MTIFVVDNSIDAVLSALFVSFVDKVKPDEIVDRNTYQPRFDAYVKEIATVGMLKRKTYTLPYPKTVNTPHIQASVCTK